MSKIFKIFAFLGILSLTASCDKHFFENEGDCDVTYAIRFVYDMNLKWADAFNSEVKSVNLYVFDKDGVFIKEYQGRGDELKDPGYRIMLDLPGNKTYQFLAWCGLDNETVEMESFVVPQPVVGVTRIEDLSCKLNPTNLKTKESHDISTRAGEEVCDSRLNFLYHGYLQQYLIDNQDGKHYEYTIYLTKDTNHIRIMLQQTTGNLVADDFDISLTAANGEMAWNNELIGNTPVEYLPWNMETDVLGVGNSNGIVSDYYGVVADLSTCRLIYSDASDIFLNVTRKEDGKLLFKVPMLQYSLTELDYYETAYGHKMTPQEFLDRQDEYLMTFFLDENMNWLYVVIEVLQWRVIIRNYEISL